MSEEESVVMRARAGVDDGDESCPGAHACGHIGESGNPFY